jgi:hypothetical protein
MMIVELHVDDLIQAREQQIGLTVVSRPGHLVPPNRNDWRQGIESRAAQNRNPKTQASLSLDFLAKSITLSGRIIPSDQRLPDSSRASSAAWAKATAPAVRKRSLPSLTSG